jgi:hypothetical protein
MNVLKNVLIACSLFSAAVYAQSPASPAGTQQVAQANAPQTNDVRTERRHAPSPKTKSECVGPAGFCNVFFGS